MATIIVDRCIVNMFIQTFASRPLHCEHVHPNLAHTICFNHFPRRSRTSWRGWSRRMRHAAGFTHVSSLQAIFTCMAHTYVHAPLHVHVHPCDVYDMRVGFKLIKQTRNNIFYQALNSGRELVAATDALEELQSTPYV